MIQLREKNKKMLLRLWIFFDSYLSGFIKDWRKGQKKC